MRLFPKTRARIAALDQQLDAWIEPHRPLLRALNAMAGFAALPGGVALTAYSSGFAQLLAQRCGASCSAVPARAYLAAALCGAAAIAFTDLYVRLAIRAQRAFVDPWRYVRPEPRPDEAERWVLYLFGAIGLVVFFLMAFFGGKPVAFETGRHFTVSLDAHGTLGLLVGWGGGGQAVIDCFWARARRSEHVLGDAAARRLDLEARLQAKEMVRE